MTLPMQKIRCPTRRRALEEFETAIGDDGTIYAEYTGTITDLEYEEGDTISSGATVATFPIRMR